MTTNQINDSLISAIETLASSLDNGAVGTLTLECIVQSKLGDHLYNVKYLDGIFKAYSNIPSFEYQPGDIVYVLVPDKDFSKNKIIISLPFNRNIE